MSSPVTFRYVILYGTKVIALFTNSFAGWRYVQIELVYSGQKVLKNLHLHTALYYSSIGTYLQPANQFVKISITF